MRFYIQSTSTSPVTLWAARRSRKEAAGWKVCAGAELLLGMRRAGSLNAGAGAALICHRIGGTGLFSSCTEARGCK